MGGGGEVLPETPLSPFWVESPWKCGGVILSEIIAAVKRVHRNNTEREHGALLRVENPRLAIRGHFHFFLCAFLVVSKFSTVVTWYC